MFSDGLTEHVARGTWSTTKDDPSWHAGFRRYAASKLCTMMMMYAETGELLLYSVPAYQKSPRSSPETPNLEHYLDTY